MDIEHKRVLRRKRFLLELTLPLSEDRFLDTCVRQALLDPGTVTAIKRADSQGERVQRFVGGVEAAGHGFEKLCFLLENEHCAWVSDELREDVRAEKGLVQVDDWLVKEMDIILAKYLKNDNAGQMNGSDWLKGRAELCHVLARRVQVAMETGKRRNQRVEERAVKKHGLVYMDVIKMRQELDGFLLEQGYEGSGAGWSGVGEEGGRGDLQRAVSRLKLSVELIKSCVRDLVAERERLMAERAQCLLLLRADRETNLPNLVLSFILKAGDQHRHTYTPRAAETGGAGDEEGRGAGGKSGGRAADNGRLVPGAGGQSELQTARLQINSLRMEMKTLQAKYDALEKSRRFGYASPRPVATKEPEGGKAPPAPSREKRAAPKLKPPFSRSHGGELRVTFAGVRGGGADGGGRVLPTLARVSSMSALSGLSPSLSPDEGGGEGFTGGLEPAERGESRMSDPGTNYSFPSLTPLSFAPPAFLSPRAGGTVALHANTK